MEIKINGEARVIDATELTVSQLLELEKVESPAMVAVQIDGEMVDRDSYDSATVSSGNAVDFLYFMAGG